MKKPILLFILFMMPGVVVSAADFAPTLLRISGPPVIQYDFDGSNLEIPVLVEGTAAALIFSIFTRDKSDVIGEVYNGHLGWHYVNRIDTCIYFSYPYNYEPGTNVVPWDGRNQNGEYIPYGEYTYYMWAYDNKSMKTPVTYHMCQGDFSRNDYEILTIIERDGSGLPLSNPILGEPERRWILGADPSDATNLQTCAIPTEEGWFVAGGTAIDPFDTDMFFVQESETYPHDMNNVTSRVGKYKWISEGTAELQKSWGEHDGFSYSPYLGGTGVVTDGQYLFFADNAINYTTEAYGSFHIFDREGRFVSDIGLTEWWSSPGDLEPGGQMNGGPSSLSCRDGMVFLNSYSSCLNQMVYPARYLESGDISDFFMWTNGNGDYVLDRNFEETASLPWICNDYNAMPETHGITSDRMCFSMAEITFGGDLSFGLLAPDGTGIGHFSFADQPSGWKYSVIRIIDNNSAFDGIYSDITEKTRAKPSSGIYEKHTGVGYTGHDSIKGIFGGYIDCFGPKGYVTVTFPNGGETLAAGEICDITWDITDGCYLPDRVRVEYSINNGLSWILIQKEVKTSDRTVSWRIPSIESESCLVRLSNTVFDQSYDTSDTVNEIVIGTIVDEVSSIGEYMLKQNSPNPFNPATTISFCLPESGRLKLDVFAVTGAKIATLADGVLSAGEHSVTWDASGFPSGVYFYRLRAGEFTGTGKMLLVK